MNDHARAGPGRGKCFRNVKMTKVESTNTERFMKPFLPMLPVLRNLTYKCNIVFEHFNWSNFYAHEMKDFLLAPSFLLFLEKNFRLDFCFGLGLRLSCNSISDKGSKGAGTRFRRAKLLQMQKKKVNMRHNFSSHEKVSSKAEVK
jgi:hypothetical protein